ncbi:MAG: pilus assembly protein [Aureliella sp.]
MVEFAVCLPVLVAVTLAFIDLTNLIYFRQTIKVASYDAARAAAEPTATESSVQSAVDRLLDIRGIENYSIDLPEGFAETQRGELMTLSVTVPLSEMTSFSGMSLWEDSLENGITVDVSVVKE